MSNLYALEKKVMALEFRVGRLEDAPEQGLAKRFDIFLTDRTAREEEQDDLDAKRDANIAARHAQNKLRLNWIIAIGSLAPLLVWILERILKH